MNQITLILFSSLLGVGGYLYKVWADRVKSRKLVLFYLLEIQYVLKVIPVSTEGVVDKFLGYYKKTIEQAGVPVGGNFDEIVKSLAPLINDYLENLFSAVPKSLDTNFQEAFNNSLIALAKDSPVLAYQLKGRQSLEKISQAVKGYSTNLNEIPGVLDDKLYGSLIKEELTNTTAATFSEISEEINNDIIRVARACDPITYRNCKKAINKKIELEEDFAELGIDEIVKAFIPKIREEVSKNAIATAKATKTF